MIPLTTAQVSAEEINTRLRNTRTEMQKYGLSAAIIACPDNIYYLTSFAGFVHERPFLLVITEQDMVFIVPKLELRHVQRYLTGSATLRDYDEFPAPRGSRWSDRLADLLPRQGTVGIEATCPAFVRDQIRTTAQVCNIVATLRQIKSPHEISRIAWSARVMSDALALMLSTTRPGRSVAEAISPVSPFLYDRCLREIRDFNVMATRANGIIQPDPFSDDPHNFSCLTTPCQPGGPYLSLVAGRLNGYGAEIERTFFLETLPETARRPFDTMMAMRDKALEMLKPGAVGSEIDAACRTIAAQAGYGDTLLHRTGHSFGVTGHEGPFLAIGDDTIIRPGMLFSIEPGLYLPGTGGFRHSDTVLVTETGCELLTHHPADAESLTLRT